ncbi:undecaprenyldiphospho-muramoylpentapeptide beta-N-acetylglucosaminyltransferase [Puteibacter caeruleilacunae]|nr:undecaprenyldiphospho-muramoylpentapeptide beta-N-acetylglucosaminyltransferase [Puteibacter caeruleilacunae]
MKQKKYIISGGGTGGHIFPALSIANELKAKDPLCEILFVGAIGRMEMEKVPAAGYEIIGLPIMGLPRKPSVKMFQFLKNWFKSKSLARKIVKDFQPDAVIGVGGYASGPILNMASKLGVPTILQEQNSYAGLTNRMLSKRAKKICVAYDEMERYFPADRIVMTGNPVRRDLLNLPDKSNGKAHFELKDDKPTLLVLGGSLGAKSINDVLLAKIDHLAQMDVNVIWQTGKLYYKRITKELEGRTPGNVHILEFISKMDMAYSAADMIVSRAGAGTISELCLVGKPIILIPSPNVAEDHQTKNAMALVKKNAAVMVRDSQIEDSLLSSIEELLKDDSQMAELSKNIKELAKPDAASHIVDEIKDAIV